MSSSDAKVSKKYMVKDLKFTNNSIFESALAEVIFMLFNHGVGFERMKQGQTISNEVKISGGHIYFSSELNLLTCMVLRVLMIYVLFRKYS